MDSLDDIVTNEINKFKQAVTEYKNSEKMSYSQLAMYCDTDPGTLYNFLNVNSSGRYDLVRKISLGTGVPLF